MADKCNVKIICLGSNETLSTSFDVLDAPCDLTPLFPHNAFRMYFDPFSSIVAINRDVNNDLCKIYN